jgi:endonuclease/exonuclease/phosphatase family metal-dependent hydrolase
MTCQTLRVLTWNLYHGRSLPPAGRQLADEFAAQLAGWDWDVALLQEVPPWWPPHLARAAGAEQRMALTSRNALLPVRRALGERWPDLLKSNAGGCNAILARRPIGEHRVRRLRFWPERRVAQLARLSCGVYLVNLHASSREELAQAELSGLIAWATGLPEREPLVLGGDLNLRAPETIARGLAHVARRDVDHVFARGLERVGSAQQLERDVMVGGGSVLLSDHPPLAVALRKA